MSIEQEHTEPATRSEMVDGTTSSGVESVSMEQGMYISLNLRRTPPRGVSLSALNLSEISALPAMVRRVDEEGIVTARIELGEKHWNIEIPGSTEPLVILSEQTSRAVSADLEATALPAKLDELLGVVPGDVPVGATISLFAHEYLVLCRV